MPNVPRPILSHLISMDTGAFVMDYIDQTKTIPDSECLKSELDSLANREAIEFKGDKWLITKTGRNMLDKGISSEDTELSTTPQGQFLLYFILTKRSIPNLVDETLTKAIQSLIDNKYIIHYGNEYRVTESGNMNRHTLGAKKD